MTTATAKAADHGYPQFGAFRDPRDLKPNPDNARGKIDEKGEDFAQLCASVAQVGVLSPIIISKKNEIIAGHRRHRAALKCRLKKVPVIIWTGDDAAAAEIALVENACRADLTALQMADAIGALLDAGRTQQQAADLLNVTPTVIARYSRLRTLTPAWRAKIKEGKHGYDRLETNTLISLAAMVPAAQDELLAYFHKQGFIHDNFVTGQIRQRLMELATAPFDVKKDKLWGIVGPCAACPKRAGAVPNLFSDVAADAKAGELPKGDRCLDATCFRQKHAAQLRTSLEAAAIAGGCEGDDGPVLIMPSHGDNDWMIKTAGKLPKRAEQGYNVEGRVVSFEGSDKAPKNAEIAVDAATCRIVWLKKHAAPERTKLDAGGKKVKRDAGDKLTLKEKQRALHDRRDRHVIAAFLEQLAEEKRMPVSNDAMIHLMRSFGCGGSGAITKSQAGLVEDRWPSVCDRIVDELKEWKLKGAPDTISLGFWAIQQTRLIKPGPLNTLKELADAAVKAIPQPKSWTAKEGK